MNREIKFRIWHKKGKEWCGILYPNQTISPHSLEYEQEDLVFCQFTGLKDSKSKEIFEGDIIQLEGSPYKYEVVWNRWQWGIDSKGIVAEFIQGFTNAVEDRAIVVGNIFENPELLKQNE